ncbi:hypothetical protein [Paenibacillus sp. FSL R7-0652]|uniref:Uncharacterized protein n=1 Tax=Paenibacillus sp. AN1007 TaxID=3151385 RepID=A0AAU8NMK9_9BACL
MNTSHWITICILIVLLLLALNLIINYISRKDQEKAPPIIVKIWLIPVLAALIIIPVAVFTMVYNLFFYSIGEISNFLHFENFGDITVFSILIITGFILFETLVHPIIVTLLNYGMKKQVSIYTRNAITILADSVIIYILASSFVSIYIADFWSALSISVFYHIIEWVLTLCYKLFKKKSKNNSNWI